MRRAITALRDGAFALELDNGARIQVALRLHAGQRAATIDFAGTSAQLANNFNAPLAVTMAAVLYVFRTLVDDEIPLNAGCLRPIAVLLPEGCMLSPRWPGAVVAGNAVNEAAKVVRKKALKLAGDLFECSEDDLVIADAEGAVALAGVMGGASSEIRPPDP